MKMRMIFIRAMFFVSMGLSALFGIYDIIPETIFAAAFVDAVVDCSLFFIYTIIIFLSYCFFENKIVQMWENRQEIAKDIGAFFESADKCPLCGGNEIKNVATDYASPMFHDPGGDLSPPLRCCNNCGNVFC